MNKVWSENEWGKGDAENLQPILSTSSSKHLITFFSTNHFDSWEHVWEADSHGFDIWLNCDFLKCGNKGEKEDLSE